jgi:hypothetical protein
VLGHLHIHDIVAGHLHIHDIVAGHLHIHDIVAGHLHIHDIVAGHLHIRDNVVQEKNVTVTLIKPEKEKWHKGANKTWVVEKKYKGLTVSTQLVEPAIIGGPLYDKLGERYVCYFPGITPQPSAVRTLLLLLLTTTTETLRLCKGRTHVCKLECMRLTIRASPSFSLVTCHMELPSNVALHLTCCSLGNHVPGHAKGTWETWMTEWTSLTLSWTA